VDVFILKATVKLSINSFHESSP